MGEFSLDLRTIEDHIEDPEPDDDAASSVVLGVLDGTTDPGEWSDAVADGSVLVLDIEGDVNELAAGFAKDVRDVGGDLVQFRGFLVVTPPGVALDTTRLA